MDEILHQLGQLVLGSVPTMVLFIVLVIAYGLLVRRPLEATLAERRARTSGAIDQAKGAMSAAEAETAVFEDKLRSANAEIFAAREARLKDWAADRERALGEARTATQSRVAAAKAEIEAGMSAARAQIESMSSDLSAGILKAVLPPGVSGTEAPR